MQLPSTPVYFSCFSWIFWRLSDTARPGTSETWTALEKRGWDLAEDLPRNLETFVQRVAGVDIISIQVAISVVIQDVPGEQKFLFFMFLSSPVWIPLVLSKCHPNARSYHTVGLIKWLPVDSSNDFVWLLATHHANSQPRALPPCLVAACRGSPLESNGIPPRFLSWYEGNGNTMDNHGQHVRTFSTRSSASPHLGSGGYLAGQRWRGPSESSGQARTSSLICLPTSCYVGSSISSLFLKHFNLELKLAKSEVTVVQNSLRPTLTFAILAYEL